MAAAVPNHYQRLGVEPHADPTDLRAAYLRLVHLMHPDQHPDLPPAEARLMNRRLREVNESFKVLQDPLTRREHDDFLERHGLLEGDGSPRPMKPPQVADN